MDQFIRGVRRFFFMLMKPKLTYYHLAIISMLFITKTNLLCIIWNGVFVMYGATPTKLLDGPMRATSILLLIIYPCPSFPDHNLLHILLAIYLQIANGILLGVNLRIHCTFFPEYCYYEYPMKPESDNFATEMMFIVFQVIITINMVFAVWFIKSMKRLIIAGMVAGAQFIVNDFFIIISAINFVLVVVDVQMQDFVIVFLIIITVFKFIIDCVLMNPLYDFMAYDFSMFLEDYDFNDAWNPEEYYSHPEEFQFWDVFEPDNEFYPD